MKGKYRITDQANYKKEEKRKKESERVFYSILNLKFLNNRYYRTYKTKPLSASIRLLAHYATDIGTYTFLTNRKRDKTRQVCIYNLHSLKPCRFASTE